MGRTHCDGPRRSGARGCHLGETWHYGFVEPLCWAGATKRDSRKSLALCSESSLAQNQFYILARARCFLESEKDRLTIEDFKETWWRELRAVREPPRVGFRSLLHLSARERPLRDARFGQLLAPFHGVEELIVGFGLLKAID